MIRNKQKTKTFAAKNCLLALLQKEKKMTKSRKKWPTKNKYFANDKNGASQPMCGASRLPSVFGLLLRFLRRFVS